MKANMPSTNPFLYFILVHNDSSIKLIKLKLVEEQKIIRQLHNYSFITKNCQTLAVSGFNNVKIFCFSFSILHHYNIFELCTQNKQLADVTLSSGNL